MAVVVLEIPARPAYLSLVRLVVDAAVGALAPGIGGARLDDLKLAVTEACSNAIEAHQSTWEKTPIVVRCDLDDRAVTVEVADRGGGFEPGALGALPAATDPLRLRYESGLGIPLMRALTDDIVFVPGPDGTTVRLTVYRPEAT